MGRRRNKKEYDRINDLIKKRFALRLSNAIPYCGKTMIGRECIAELFKDLGYKYGAEIGVKGGRNSRMIAKTIPGLKLLCVDPWREKMLSNAKKRLKNYDVTYMRMTSMEAVEQIKDRSLDFVYIDAVHTFDFVMQDIIKWSQKVKHGGIVSGHDYHPFGWSGVVKAVDAYTSAHNIFDWYITYDKKTSFFWVNE